MIVAHELRRTFGNGSRAVRAVDGVSFEAARGELCVVVGRSGSGKTSLLNLVGGLDRPHSGELAIDGRPVFGEGVRTGDGELAALRRNTLGFVFQSFALLPVLTAAENIAMPLRLRRMPVARREERVRLLLDLVGLAAHGKQRPAELSGGQQQRVAIARALANTPRLLIADEPTGQLDRETGRSVMRLLRAVIAAEGVTALVATHDAAMVELADRVLTLRDGRLIDI
ncbi:ABC transporter ATP-binding protein [Actinocrinis sp.]|jgi:putative ABC transport system ATP-binding protein|uniref:ABC transporter ATP-binding protein n=1 Tax=Actinocrinis sp. TaxID=1920516 RepID=UPI0032C243CA